MSEQIPWWPSRYGAGDQLGTLNEITPAKTVAAARLVRQGKVYDLGRVLDANVPHFEGRYWQQTLVSSAHIINPNGTLQIGTHLDGLNHLQMGDRFYNGFQTQDIVEEWGTNKLGIETIPPIITRGILVDVARAHGVDRLDAGYVITVEDTERALRQAGVAVEPGDVVLFHTGWGSLWDTDHALFNSGEPGIGMAMAEWLVENRVAMTGADTWSYGAVPNEDPSRPFVVPQMLNIQYGLFIMENVATEVIARAQVYEFMFTLTHAKTRGSTAAGIAPAAVV
jgi:kynurenine formamidase